jgi:hypothetical protein
VLHIHNTVDTDDCLPLKSIQRKEAPPFISL